MRFNVLLVAFMIVAGGALADSPSLGIESLQSLKERVLEHYSRLGDKIAACNTLKDRPITIADKWLLEQTIQDRKVVLFALYHRAKQRCSQAEEDAYTLALVDLAVQSGDKTALDAWLDLKKHDLIDPRVKSTLQRLGEEEIERLSGSPNYYYPFDLMAISSD